jgi:hypothetical protein
MARKQSEPVEAPAAPSGDVPRIVKRVPHPVVKRDFAGNVIKDARDRHLAGVYRVIHGAIYLPRPVELWQNADGTRKPGQDPQEAALPGDEVYFGDEDAARFLDSNLIEELSANPSRVPRYNEKGEYVSGVFKPPVIVPNVNNIGPSR